MEEKKITEAQKRETCTLMLCLLSCLYTDEVTKIPVRLIKSMMRYYDPYLPVIDQPVPLNARECCWHRDTPGYSDEIDGYWNDGAEGPYTNHFPLYPKPEDRPEWEALRAKIPRGQEWNTTESIAHTVMDKIASDDCMRGVYNLVFKSMGVITEDYGCELPPQCKAFVTELVSYSED